MDFPACKTILMTCLAILITASLAACSTPLLTPAIPTPTLTATVTSILPTPTQTATATPQGCQEQKGTISVTSVPSKLLKGSIELRVYTPPCYADISPTRYSVLYMLHGQTYDDQQWQLLGLTDAADNLIATKQIAPLIIVMPNEAASMSDANTSAFGDALVNEVIPWVDQHYAACEERTCRAIGGLSRGGNWAVHLGLSHPELFAAIGAHSTPLFYGDLTLTGMWIKKIPATTPLPMIYIDFGKSDEDKGNMLQFEKELNDLGVAHQMIQFTGDHDAEYWSAHVDDYLRWYSASLAAPQE